MLQLNSLIKIVGLRMANYLPTPARTAAYRHMVRCDRVLPSGVVLKLAETQDELEACYRLLHDAYVDAGFMQPHPSGLRTTVYHALPTTSTLLAKYKNRVIGTLSLIRQNPLGLPMEKAFDLSGIDGNPALIAEVSSLAVDRQFQSRSQMILFPLIKFMYEYATRYFNCRHLVIAVNPRHIPFYESILQFKRLNQKLIEKYDFANGAPAVGAHLDLENAPVVFKRVYGNLSAEKNLYRYFTETVIPNIQFPNRRFHTTNDPVMTPELLEYFFRQRTPLLDELSEKETRLLRDIYNLPEYQQVLPAPANQSRIHSAVPDYHRFSIHCPGEMRQESRWLKEKHEVVVIECSPHGLRFVSNRPLKLHEEYELELQLGEQERSKLLIRPLRPSKTRANAFVAKILSSDARWHKFTSALKHAATVEELNDATRFVR